MAKNESKVPKVVKILGVCESVEAPRFLGWVKKETNQMWWFAHINVLFPCEIF